MKLFFLLLLASCLPVIVLVAGFLLPASPQAGGPISITSEGDPSAWDSPITLHPEGGTCGTFSNAQMIVKIEDSLEYWTGIAGISLEIGLEEGEISGNVDEDNYTDYFVGYDNGGNFYDDGLQDDINPIIFDDNGSIVDALYGNGARFSILGFAGPDAYTDCNYSIIADGQGFFNCRCLEGSPSGECPGDIVFTEEDLTFTMTHEIGHMLGADHSQVNQSVWEDNDESCDLDVPGDCDGLPLMFPVSVDAGDQLPPMRDDEVAMLTLYGRSYLENNFVTVTGSLTDEDGLPLRCADVQAETDDPLDAVAVVSGIFAPNQDLDGDGLTDGEGECLGDCGDFILRGLDPDKNYTITVRPIDSAWTNGSGIFPCDPPLTGIEEEQIDSFSAGDVSAGDTRDLGTIETTSTGGVEEGTRNSISGPVFRSVIRSVSSCDSGSNSSSVSGCNLSRNAVKSAHGFLFLAFFGFIFAFKHAREKNVIPAPRKFL